MGKNEEDKRRYGLYCEMIEQLDEMCIRDRPQRELRLIRESTATGPVPIPVPGKKFFWKIPLFQFSSTVIPLEKMLRIRL